MHKVEKFVVMDEKITPLTTEYGDLFMYEVIIVRPSRDTMLPITPTDRRPNPSDSQAISNVSERLIEYIRFLVRLSSKLFLRRVTLSITKQNDEDQEILSLEIFPDMTLDTVRSSVQAETGIDPRSQHLYHNGRLITDSSKTMEELQIGDGEMLALHVRSSRSNAGAGPSNPGRQQREQQGSAALDHDPEVMRLTILGNPATRALIQQNNPQLAAVLDDPVAFRNMISGDRDRERRERAERQRAIQALNDDPFNVESQAKIEEMIRQECVQENLQINGNKVQALVDSGAQVTIMSPACAEACGIMRLVDTRFSGIARGVGTANIIGRVHTAPIKIGSLHLPCSFTVMEGKAVDLLLGIDMLKRYQACIDLMKNKLVIQGQEIDFLGEADIPRQLEEQILDEPTISGPGGTTIGARSGAIRAPAATGSSAGAADPVSATPAPSAPAPAQASAPAYPQEHIDTLMGLGFTREKAIEALRSTDGNLEYAANYLYQQL
ncbi:DNA damage-inducible protein 1 [Pyricularia oryzae Y34]|uniref:DNA damage-inducible protein 1 n=2 Tax=Pyricularia oryzae TaxID=318829 RepID=A0AA97PH39_PYRO3|nr:DNA damage-inducible protein 1 [Pyricularia oryzae Y34]